MRLATPFIIAAVLNFGTPASAQEGREWWHHFGDDNLNALVEKGIAQNGDLEAARHRVMMAEAQIGAALSPMLPSLSLDYSTQVSPTNALGFQAQAFGIGGAFASPFPQSLDEQLFSLTKEDPADLFWQGSLFLNGRLQIDLGRSYYNKKATEDDVSANRADADNQMLGLSAQIAQGYFGYIKARNQLTIVEKQIEINRGLLEVIRLRFERGEAIGLDVLQQQQQLAQSETQLPASKAQVQVLKMQLLALMAEPLDGKLPAASTLPTLPSLAKSDVENFRIEAHPTMRKIQANEDGASARETSSYLAYLPTISLTGQVGGQAQIFDELDTQPTWGAGVGVSLPLFQGGLRYASMKSAQRMKSAQQQMRRQAKLRLEQTVAAAQTQEVAADEQLEAAGRQQTAAQAAFSESKERYLAGLANYQSVQIALNAAFISELTVLNAKHQLILSRLQLLNAFGGQI